MTFGSPAERSPRLLRVAAPALAVACLLASCGGDGDARPDPTPRDVALADSLFVNPGLEDGPEPWISLDTAAWGAPFTVSQAQSRSGSNSALLRLRSDEPGSEENRVYGVVQEISPDGFPEFLSGAYYVENWQKGTRKQYLQFVVIVFDAANAPAGLGATNYQLRYPLAGIDEPPFEIANAKFIFITEEEPRAGRWVSFERNIRRDFEEQWGAVPQGFSRIRILFEVRWDGRGPGDPPSVADVYYDDLYVGPAPDGVAD